MMISIQCNITWLHNIMKNVMKLVYLTRLYIWHATDTIVMQSWIVGLLVVVSLIMISINVSYDRIT